MDSVTPRGELDLTWVDTTLREWASIDKEGHPKGDDHYLLFMALLRPDGMKVVAFPCWDGEVEDEEAFRADMHKWVDCVLAKRTGPADEWPAELIDD